MPEAILITGANGFIGSYTVSRLESMHRVVVPVDVVPRSRELSLLPISTPTRVLDVTATEGLRELCRKERVTHIFHAAHPPREEDPEVIDFGVRAMRNVLEAARAFGIRRVVFASSGAVYGPLRKSDGKPITEGDPIGIYPTFLYRSAKIIGEWLGDFYATHHGVSFVALRFATVYGPGQARGIPLAIKEGMAGRECAPYLTRIPDDLIYVEDAAEAVLVALLNDKPSSPAYNIGSGRGYTEADLERAMREALPEIPFHIGRHPQAETTARYRDRDLMDTTKARVELEFNPKIELGRGIAKIADWLRKHGGDLR